MCPAVGSLASAQGLRAGCDDTRIRQLAAAAAVGDERAQAAGQDPASVRSVETLGGSVPTEAAAAGEPLTGTARKPGARDRSVAAEVQRLALLCLHNFGLTGG